MDEPKQYQVRVSQMSAERMRLNSKRIIDALNDMQFVDRLTLDETLLIAMYTLGATLKTRGLVLDVNAPLVRALPPLASGFTQAKMPVIAHPVDMTDEQMAAAAVSARERTAEQVTATIEQSSSGTTTVGYDPKTPEDVHRMAQDIGTGFANSIAAIVTHMPLEMRVLFYSYLFLPAMGYMTEAIGPAAARAIMELPKEFSDATNESLDGPAMESFRKVMSPDVAGQKPGHAESIESLGFKIGRSWNGEMTAMLEALPPAELQRFYAAVLAPVFGQMLRQMGLAPSIEVLETSERVLRDLDARQPASTTRH